MPFFIHKNELDKELCVLELLISLAIAAMILFVWAVITNKDLLWHFIKRHFF
jgi:hypothetical protein